MVKTLHIFFFLLLMTISLKCTNTTDLTETDCYAEFIVETEKLLNTDVKIWKEPVSSINYYTIGINYNLKNHERLPERLSNISQSVSENFVSKLCNEENRIVKVIITHSLVDITKGNSYETTEVKKSQTHEYIYEDSVCYSKGT
tara:strand:+ start:151 stop:582 length:432 start_codon:yes stop_codon:yes gene_type:complete